MAALLNTAKIAITVALAAVVAVNSHQLYEMSKVYQAEEKSHERLMAFSPRLAAEAPNSEPPDWPVFFESESSYGFLSYVKSHASLWRDIELKPEDRLVTLSTCSYDFKDARAAIVGRLVKPE